MNVTTELILSIIRLQQNLRFTIFHNVIVWHRKVSALKQLHKSNEDEVNLLNILWKKKKTTLEAIIPFHAK